VADAEFEKSWNSVSTYSVLAEGRKLRETLSAMAAWNKLSFWPPYAMSCDNPVNYSSEVSVVALT
jgi:hypothetical protein